MLPVMTALAPIMQSSPMIAPLDHRRVHPDYAAVADGSAVDDRPVPDGDVLPYDRRKAGLHVKDAACSCTLFPPDHHSVMVGAYHRVGPYAHPITQPVVADPAPLSDRCTCSRDRPLDRYRAGRPYTISLAGKWAAQSISMRGHDDHSTCCPKRASCHRSRAHTEGEQHQAHDRRGAIMAQLAARFGEMQSAGNWQGCCMTSTWRSARPWRTRRHSEGHPLRQGGR